VLATGPAVRMKVALPQINFMEIPHWMSAAYTAVLEMSEDSVLFLSGLLHAERARRGTRKGRRALGPTGSDSPVRHLHVQKALEQR
jgi:hypothetical protein